MSLLADKHFPCSLSSVAEARSFVSETLVELDVDLDLDGVKLLVSELATNAVTHACTPFDVSVHQTGDGVRVEVSDGSLVQPAASEPSAPGGFGLSIVDTLADSWGFTPSGRGKVVWFELLAMASASPAPDRGRAPEPAEPGRSSPTYTIGAVSQLLAIEPSTLRAWEQRYGVVVPLRTRGGHRLYSRDQVDQLRFVTAQIAAGMTAADAHRVLQERAGSVTFIPVEPEVSMLVLLAERDPFAADLAEYFLRTEGYEVRIALDEHETRRLLAQHRPDLVILELLLPGGSGIELCRELASAGVSVLAVSSLAMRDPAMEAGASAFLGKPFEPLRLVSTVRDLAGTSALSRGAVGNHHRDPAHH
jgi:CheY-like chemotaxis protein/anti-sigma regulatory factor (Ser/Thr protein kinase)